MHSVEVYDQIWRANEERDYEEQNSNGISYKYFIIIIIMVFI